MGLRLGPEPLGGSETQCQGASAVPANSRHTVRGTSCGVPFEACFKADKTEAQRSQVTCPEMLSKLRRSKFKFK